MTKTDVLIIGAGHVGLTASYFLKKAGVQHLVLEKGEVANTWRTKRWDSFHLVLPNWTLRLPGFEYSGNDPDGFFDLKATISYVEAFKKKFELPVKEGVEVKNLRYEEELGEFQVTTPQGNFASKQIIVATGGFQKPMVPGFSKNIPNTIFQIHSSEYRNPAQLADGGVVVIGTGQSGAQIAEELHASGRKVFLSVSRCGGRPRKYRGKDCVWWMNQMGFYDQTVDKLAPGKSKLACNVPLTGYQGGHDIDLREFAERGIVLLGKALDVANGKMNFDADLEERLSFADSEWLRFLKEADAHAERQNLNLPPDSSAHRIRNKRAVPQIPSLDLTKDGFTNVIWATGYQLAFDWINVPMFSENGFPKQNRGISEHKGLYFLGLPWLHKRKSSIFLGTTEDAEFVVKEVLNQL